MHYIVNLLHVLKISLITAILGAIRNYIKLKQFSILNFIRTPIVVFFIYTLLYLSEIIVSPYAICIMERWLFLVAKGILSYFRNDYYTKKDKYEQKYKIKYNKIEID